MSAEESRTTGGTIRRFVPLVRRSVGHNTMKTKNAILLVFSLLATGCATIPQETPRVVTCWPKWAENGPGHGFDYSQDLTNSVRNFVFILLNTTHSEITAHPLPISALSTKYAHIQYLNEGRWERYDLSGVRALSSLAGWSPTVLRPGDAIVFQVDESFDLRQKSWRVGIPYWILEGKALRFAGTVTGDIIDKESWPIDKESWPTRN